VVNNYIGEKTLSLIVPGEILPKRNSGMTRVGDGNSLWMQNEAYQKWKTAARIWALYSIDSRTFPFKDACKGRVHIYYRGKRPDFEDCLQSIGDCFQGILWFDEGQIVSWDDSKLIKDNVYPRLDMVIRWQSGNG